MSRLDWILAAASLVLASTTIYYARVLHLERAERAHLALESPEPAATASPSMPPGPRVPPPAPPSPPPAVATNARVNAPESGAEPASPERKDPGDMAVARHRLEQLRDPAGRAAMIKEGEQELRRMFGREVEIMPGRKKPGMDLPPEEADRVIGPLVEYMLQMQERTYECEADPSCDESALEAELQPAIEAQIAALIGTERFERFMKQEAAPQPQATPP